LTAEQAWTTTALLSTLLFTTKLIVTHASDGWTIGYAAERATITTPLLHRIAPHHATSAAKFN
jgi:hypothetical protein